MINITINAETGAEARGALLELLGLAGQLTACVDFTQLKEQNAEVQKTFMQVAAIDPGIIIGNGIHNGSELVETAVKKRRSKAEIEAEKNAIDNGQEKVQEMVEAQTAAETKTEEPAAETTVTKEDLQKKAVELGRVGKKELCRAVLQKYGADSISTADKNPLKLELYATVLEEFNKL